MRVGVLGTIWLNTPPAGYGGTEDVVCNLVNGLVERGHNVTLFGPKTAKVKAKVYPTVDSPLKQKNIDWTNLGYTLSHITEGFDHIDEFDVLHVHLNKAQDYVALPLAVYSKVPVLFTLHFMLPSEDDELAADRIFLLKKYSRLPYVSISNSQQKPINLNFIRTIYNGIDLKRFPFSNRKGTYLVWLGKINPLKGTEEAILAAKKAGIKIYVMGTIDRGVPKMLSYYENKIKPLIDDKEVMWLGEVSHLEKTSILSGALAFLNPIQWEEPFGLVMAEAQAVGTPVISFRRGSAEELIVDGHTGFLVDNLEEMADRIKDIRYLDRNACRKNVEELFSIEKMVDGYEEAYGVAIENWEKYKLEQNNMLKIQNTK